MKPQRIQTPAFVLGLLLVSIQPTSAQSVSYQTMERRAPREIVKNPNSRMDSKVRPAENQDEVAKDVQRMGPSPGVPRVPTVVGLSITNAENALYQAGFKSKETFEDAPDPSVLYGHVRMTVPAAGTLAKAGDLVELKIPRAASKVEIGALSPSDVERRDGFDLDEGQYQEITHGADVVLRKHEDERRAGENGASDYYTGHGLYIEPSDGAALAYLDDTRDIDNYGLGSYLFYAQCEDALKHTHSPGVRIDQPQYGVATICVLTSAHQIVAVQFKLSDNPYNEVTDYKFHYALFPPEPLERPQLPDRKRLQKYQWDRRTGNEGGG